MAADQKMTPEVDDEAGSASGADAAAGARGADVVAGDEARAGASRRGGRAGRILAVVVILALLASTAVLGYLLWQGHQEDELRRAATDDASRLVVQLASYDHTDVDANLAVVTAEATTDFAERYREVSEGLRELLASGEGTSTGTVTHAAVESVDDERAVVLVFLDQEISNVTVPEGRVDSSRMVVTLVRDDERWLLDDAQLA